MIKVTKSNESHIAALLLVVAMSFAFFAVGASFAQAEEATTTEDVAETNKKAEMVKQIDSLRAMLAERKAALETKKEEFKQEHKEAKEEAKAEFKINKEEFFASLEGLTEEERRAAMVEFITNVKEQIAARKAEFEAKKTEFKQEKEALKEEFKQNKAELKDEFSGLTREEKIAAILVKVEKFKQQLLSRVDDSEDASDDLEDDEADDTSDDSDTDDSEDDDSSDDSDEDVTQS